MRIINPSFEIIDFPDENSTLKKIEISGRTCYKSEHKAERDSAQQFAEMILKRNHFSVLEHVNITVRLICDRGISHEIVRHRLASYSQESTRYANYSNERFGSEITVIRPFFWQEGEEKYNLWLHATKEAEKAYLALIKQGASPQEARSVLPNSLKTEVVITCNLREWHHIFSLRCAPAAHPQMREIMLPLLNEFAKRLPVIFNSLAKQFSNQ